MSGTDFGYIDARKSFSVPDTFRPLTLFSSLSDEGNLIWREGVRLDQENIIDPE